MVSINGKHPEKQEERSTVKGFECDEHRIPLDDVLARYGTNATKVVFFFLHELFKKRYFLNVA